VRREQARWTCPGEGAGEGKRGNVCFGAGEERLELVFDRLRHKYDLEVSRVEGNMIFGQLHGLVRMAVGLGRVAYAEMCLGVVCGPVQVYAGATLETVISMDGAGVWEFDSRVLDTASFTQSGAELTVIILEDEEELSDYALFGKEDGDTYYKARLEKVEIVNKFAWPGYALDKSPLFNGSALVTQEDSTNHWYKHTKALLRMEKSPKISLKNRTSFEHKCPASLAKFISKQGMTVNSKISPSLPKNLSSSLDCSNIFQTRPDQQRNRTGFVSFPGSGAMWIRIMLEMGTGLNTAIHMTEPHKDGGSLVTMSHHALLDPAEPDPGWWYKIDSHRRFANMLYFHGRAVLLIRNPFSAIISMFRHVHFGFHSSSDIAVKEDILNLFKPESVRVFFTRKFRKFASKSILKWRKIIEDWVILGDCLVVHFEDVQEDKLKEIIRIINFLEVNPDHQRLTCLQYSTVDIFKRKSKKMPRSPFSRQLSENIRKHIDQVDQLLQEFGHPGIPYNKYQIF